MFKDRFDKILCGLLAVTLIALAAVLSGFGNDGRTGEPAAGPDKALEREMAYQARVNLLQQLYGPVETLQRAGQPQQALFKLDELTRSYPQEAHGYILKGAILFELGALDEALAAYVEGLRRNGDYVDRKSPLSRRAAIQQVVDGGLPQVAARARANPGNRSLVVAQQNLNYLRSRLAGGCE